MDQLSEPVVSKVAPPVLHRPAGRWGVALVEDHLLQRTHTERLLASQGDILVVWSGQTLPDFIQWWDRATEAERPDLLLLDLLVDRGPRADPLLVERLVAAGLRVLLFSAMASPPQVQRMLRIGVSGVIGKQDTESDILTAVRTVLRDGEWITPELALVIADDPQRPQLSRQEERALVLYASGLTTDAVAVAMAIERNTVKKYIERIKRKYAESGRPVSTKFDLRRAAMDDGFVEPLTEGNG